MRFLFTHIGFCNSPLMGKSEHCSVPQCVTAYLAAFYHHYITLKPYRPFLSQEGTQLLVQSLVISRLDYCNTLIAGPKALAADSECSSLVCLQFSQVHSCHSIAVLPSLASSSSPHWVKNLHACLQSQEWTSPSLPYGNGQKLICTLTSTSTYQLDPPSLKMHRRQVSRLFSALGTRWWNELPLAV